MCGPTRRLRQVRRVAILLALSVLLVLGIAAGSVWLWAGYAYRYALSAQMPVLARAVLAYRDEWGVLPPGVQELRASGYGGVGACALPRTRWEALMARRTGPAPWYCPVRHWDGKTPYVVAVLGIPCGSPPQRCYAIVGRTKGLWATEEELFKLLEADDTLRERNGEPALWRDAALARKRGVATFPAIDEVEQKGHAPNTP